MPMAVPMPMPVPMPVSAVPAPVQRAEVVRYDERVAPAIVIEGAPARIALAFGLGILIGALAVVALMEEYEAAVRPKHPSIATRPLRLEAPVVVRYAPPPAPAPAPAPTPPAPLPGLHLAAAPPHAPQAAGPTDTPATPGPEAGAASVVAAAPPPRDGVTSLPAAAHPVAGLAAKPPAPTPPVAAARPVVKPKPKARAKAGRPKRKVRPAATTLPPTTEGRIVVETKPASRGKVTVWVDGKDRGTAPLKLKIKPGVHEIQTVQGTGYPELRMVRVQPGGLARVVVPLAK
jgi:hypothetical protein